MSATIDQKKWMCIKENNQKISSRFDSICSDLSVTYMPINATSLLYAQKLPDEHPLDNFILEFIVSSGQDSRIISAMQSSGLFSYRSKLAHKHILFFSDNDYFGRIDIYKTFVTTPNNSIDTNKLFARGIPVHKTRYILPAPEDSLLMIICTTYHFLGKNINPDTSFHLENIINHNKFNKKRFLELSGHYNMNLFTPFLISSLRVANSDTLAFSNFNNKYYHKRHTFIYKLYCRFTNPLFKKVIQFYFTPNKFHLAISLAIKKSRLVFSQTKKYTAEKFCNMLIHVAHSQIARMENNNFDSISDSLKYQPRTITATNSLPAPLLVSTNSGIWMYKDGHLFCIAYGWTYGITAIQDKWYAIQSTGTFARLISFHLPSGSAQYHSCNAIPIKLGLDSFIHQIDSYDQEIYIADTSNNRIIRISQTGKLESFYPNRSIRNKDFNHFNSLFITKEFIYLLAHNKKSGLPSQIYKICRLSMKTVDIIETSASMAHNIFYYKDVFTLCDSHTGRLLYGNRVLFKNSNYFLRGLAMNETHIFIGGSVHAARNLRYHGTSVIWCIESNGKLVSSIQLPSIGQIYDIRLIEGDYCLSSFSSRKN